MTSLPAQHRLSATRLLPSTLRQTLAAIGMIGSASILGAQAAPPAPPTPPTTPAAATAPSAPVAPATPTYRASHAEALEVGRATVRAAFTGQIDSLVAMADPSATASGDLRGRLTDGVAQISLQLGAERRMIAERVMLVEGNVEYWRTAEYEMVPVPLVFRVIMGGKGKWRGFTANTEEMTPAGDEVKP